MNKLRKTPVLQLKQSSSLLTLYLLRLQLHGAIYRPDSFVMMLRYCATLKVIRYESTSLNRIVADKSHHVIVALTNKSCAKSTCWDTHATDSINKSGQKDTEASIIVTVRFRGEACSY